MRRVVDSYGYEEYDGPLLESLDIYKAKSGEEIVDRQLYDFVDKGDRHVAIRPEMTPTLARMVAAKVRELPRPIRWYSIPNLWRYEQPGHGRLREHWQLNVDIFGVNSINAEAEVIQLACDILFAFKAPKTSFKIKISNRKLLDAFFYRTLQISSAEAHAVSKILDKKNKVEKEEFERMLMELLASKDKVEKVYTFLNSTIDDIHNLENIPDDIINDIISLFKKLTELGIGEQIEFDPSIIRGFDYYTGFIFEIFDTNPENRRSLYGGGRYDNLIGLFSGEELSGFGFGLGDVTLQNFLGTHNLIPIFEPEDTVFIPCLDNSFFVKLMGIAETLRKGGVKCSVMLDDSVKLKKQFSLAEKKGFRFVLVMGEEEVNKNIVMLKDMKKKEQREVSLPDLLSVLKKEIEMR